MCALQKDASKTAAVLEENARRFAIELGPEEIGHVLEAGDGIARVDGLPGLMAEEMVVFPNEVYGMAMNLEREHAGVIILGDYSHIEQGDLVKRTGKVLQVPVGKPLLGRVVTPLGQPIDGRGPIATTEYRHVINPRRDSWIVAAAVCFANVAVVWAPARYRNRQRAPLVAVG